MPRPHEPAPETSEPPPDARQGIEERRLRDGSRDDFVREEPLRLVIDETRLVTMRTPGQDEDFARGFLLSEGIIDTLEQIASLDFRKGMPHGEAGPGDGGHVSDRLLVRLHPDAARAREAARSLTRVHEMRPSCGLCGVEDLDELMAGREFRPGTPRFARAKLPGLLEAFRARQRVFAATGACHAAAIVTTDGHFAGFGEDVGRHNALDKAIGAAAAAGTDFGSCLGLLSGRAGYELVAKLLRVGVPILVSVSAPSALSFDLCREAGATLLGFARGDTSKLYWDEGRLGSDPVPAPEGV